ncbi:MAG: Rrf2 family transcriptional regulator [Verrucomicrobiales bacterium]|nr:Rrf2 family transcriptional regulator [Verrucomicrobiales bacterium]
MQISKKSEYAVRAIAILASHGTENSMQAQELAQAGEIPQKFLEQILLILKRGGLVVSKRGVGGGYRIAKQPRLITVLEVIINIEGDINPLPEPHSTREFPGSKGIIHCFTTATGAYQSALERTTIEDLLEHDSGDNMAGFGI